MTVFFWGFLVATATVESNSDDLHADTRVTSEVTVTHIDTGDQGACPTAAHQAASGGFTAYLTRSAAGQSNRRQTDIFP